MRVLGLITVLTAFAAAALGQPTTESVLLTAEDLPIVFERRGVTVLDQIRKQLTEYDEQGQAIKSSSNINAPDYYISAETAGRPPRTTGVVEPRTRQLYSQASSAEFVGEFRLG